MVHAQCAHRCIGLKGYDCIQCISPECVSAEAVDMTNDDYCNICWVDTLSMAPCVDLKCGHIFHFQCLLRFLEIKRCRGRIDFSYLLCPLCKWEIQHSALDDMMRSDLEMKAQIERDAVEWIKIEGLQHDKRLTDKHSPYFGDTVLFAVERVLFYQCFSCRKPYFCGLRRDTIGGLHSSNRNELICPSCVGGDGMESCKKHGDKYMVFKCKYCCSVAVWYCGTTHFCDGCYRKKTWNSNIPIRQ